MKYIQYLISILSIFSTNAVHAQEMNNGNLEKILYVVSDSISGSPGAWELVVEGMPMYCITDELMNRMRIISPVREMRNVTEEELNAAMEANFHSALDVRYAVSDEIMWSAFIHPLAQLTKEQVLDAISQVFYANLTFGTTYNSSELMFPKKEKKKLDLKRS